MTALFDWAKVAQKVFDLLYDGDDGEAYLRTRIEAAFVRLETVRQPHCETCGTDVAEVLCAKCGEWWRDNSPEVHEATARAVAAEARATELTAQLAEARESERAAVVAWLRRQMRDEYYPAETPCDHADAIEAGEHLT